MTDSINQLMTRRFVEQPLASPGSANHHVRVNFNFTKDDTEQYVLKQKLMISRPGPGQGLL